MYTCCPECRTWFRVTDAQLGAARAWVRCGQCLGSFDASTRLWSEPDEGSSRVRWEMDRDLADAVGIADAEPEAASEPAGEDVQDEPLESFSGPDLESRLEDEPFEPFSGPHLESSLEDHRARPSVPLGDVDFDVDFESDPPGPSVGDVRRVPRDNYEARPGPDRIQEGRIAARRRRSREQAILNRIEGLDVRRGRRWASNSCVVLVLLLAMQYAWFTAGDLATTFPMLGPALDKFCAVTGCETRRRAGNDGIRVVSRTVRPHAEYTSALSVRATLENRSPEVRPFPVVVFVLYGRDGRAVASRAFEPAEYLDGGAVPSVGLESGRRVNIAFDLVTPSEVAVSFDLRLI